jgi:mlo protein
MKRTIFDEQTAKALKKWHKAVVKKKHHNKGSSHDSSETPSTDTATPAREAGEWQRLHDVPVRHLHRYKTIAHVGGARSPLSDSDYSDTDDTEPLSSSQTRHLIPPAKQRSLDTERAEVRVDVVETVAAVAPRDVLQDSFSFPRLLPPHHVPDK